MSNEIIIDSNTHGISANLASLQTPPAFNKAQLEVDMPRGGIIIRNGNASPYLITNLEEINKLNELSDAQKAYVLRMGHQGLFGGGIPFVETMTQLQTQTPPVILQEAKDAGDIFRSIEIKNGKILFSHSLSYNIKNPLDINQPKSGEVQLSLVADLTNIPKDFTLNSSSIQPLKIPVHFIVSGDSRIIDVIKNSVPVNAIVTDRNIATNVRNAIDEGRSNKVLKEYQDYAKNIEAQIASADYYANRMVFLNGNKNDEKTLSQTLGFCTDQYNDTIKGAHKMRDKVESNKNLTNNEKQLLLNSIDSSIATLTKDRASLSSDFQNIDKLRARAKTFLQNDIIASLNMEKISVNEKRDTLQNSITISDELLDIALKDPQKFNQNKSPLVEALQPVVHKIFKPSDAKVDTPIWIVDQKKLHNPALQQQFAKATNYALDSYITNHSVSKAIITAAIKESGVKFDATQTKKIHDSLLLPLSKMELDKLDAQATDKLVSSAAKHLKKNVTLASIINIKGRRISGEKLPEIITLAKTMIDAVPKVVMREKPGRRHMNDGLSPQDAAMYDSVIKPVAESITPKHNQSPKNTSIATTVGAASKLISRNISASFTQPESNNPDDTPKHPLTKIQEIQQNLLQKTNNQEKPKEAKYIGKLTRERLAQFEQPSRGIGK